MYIVIFVYIYTSNALRNTGSLLCATSFNKKQATSMTESV